jgi:PAS domain S-box-containing protein
MPDLQHDRLLNSGIPQSDAFCDAAGYSSALFCHVLDHMQSGYVSMKVVYEDDRPSDFIHHEYNQAYCELIGLDNVRGKRLCEALPGSRDDCQGLFSKLVEVALHGIPMRVAWVLSDRSLWYESTIYRPKEGFVVAIIDNSTRCRLDAHTMRENAELYSTIIRISGIGTWDWDVLNDRIDCNERWFAILGYTREELEPLGMECWRSLIHPDDLAGFDSFLSKHVTTEATDLEIECRMKRKDGQWVWVSDRAQVLGRAEKGKPLRMLGTHTDSTVRKKAESSIKEREALFRSLFNSYAAIQIIVDPESGRIIDANRAAAEFYGWSIGELRRMNIRQINTHLNDFDVHHSKAINTGKQSKSICQHSRADGEERNVEVFRTRISIGDRTYIHVVIHDISERLMTEKRLMESESRFRSLFENHSAAMLLIDPLSGRIVDANQASAELYGWSRKELKRMVIQEINTLSPDDIKTALENGRARKQTYFRFQHRTADGSVRDVDVYSTRIEIDRREYLYSIIHDVTEKLRTEARLRESEELFRGLFEDHSACMIVVDPETGSIVDANLSASGFYGWSKEALRLMNITDINCASPDFVLDDIRKWEQQAHRYVVARHRRADGSVRNVEIFAKKLVIKGRPLIFDVIHDITGRIRLEAFAALRLALLEMAGSSSVEKMLQAALDEIERVTGSTVGFSFFIARDQKQLLLQAVSTNTRDHMCRAEGQGVHYPLNKAGVWADAIRERRPVIHNDYASLLHRKGMPEGHIEVRREMVVPVIRGDLVMAVFGVGNKLFDYDDEDSRWVQTVADLAWDVIEKKVAEDQYHKLQEQLQHSGKMEMVGQLASGIAHEINNPLNFIQINHATEQDYFSDFIALFNRYRQIVGQLRDGSPVDAEDVRELLQAEQKLGLDGLLNEIPEIFTETQKGIDRIKKIVEGMRSLSFRHGREAKTLSDVNKAVRDVLIMAKGEYRFHADIVTTLELVPLVPCYIDQISQVLLNLIINSVHAIQAQHRATNGLIAIHTWSDDSFVYCSVADDGPGIDESVRTNIFNPFFTTKSAGKGTGLGLSISWDIIVNKHGGQLTLECPPAGGTVFVLSVPR